MSKPSFSFFGARVYSEYILIAPLSSSRALMSSALLAELHVLAGINGDFGQQVDVAEGPAVVYPGQSDLF